MREAVYCVLVWILICVSGYLSVKRYLMRKAVREIREGFRQKLEMETNTLLTVSVRDKEMCRLAEEINIQLRILYRQRHLYQQGDRKLKESVTNLAHDIRTPLTAICGYLELIEEVCGHPSGQDMAGLEDLSGNGVGLQSQDLEKIRRYLAIIENRVEVLKNMTEELFQYSSMLSSAEESDRQESEEEVCLNRVLEEIISAYYAVLKMHQIEPSVRMPEKQVICHGSKNAVSRIFENVISNALKYSDGDLQIVLSEKGEVIFSNHAAGLDEVQTGRLFERFYTVENATKSTGLGLSIARELVERMGGRMEAAYRQGMLAIMIRLP